MTFVTFTTFHARCKKTYKQGEYKPFYSNFFLTPSLGKFPIVTLGI